MEKFKGGRGVEKKVEISPRNPDRVVGKFHQEAPSPQYVKARHYLTKILSIVFEANIPHIYLSSTHPHEIETERKEHDKDHAQISKIFKKGRWVLITPFDIIKMIKLEKKFEDDPRAQEFLKRMNMIITDGYSQTVQDLRAAHNYTRDKDGNPVYLDSFEPWVYNEDKTPSRFSFDSDALREEILKLPTEKQKDAMFAFKRLLDLWNEEQRLSLLKKKE